MSGGIGFPVSAGVIVTGSGNGIGEVVATPAARFGLRPIIWDIELGAAERVATLVRNSRGDISGDQGRRHKRIGRDCSNERVQRVRRRVSSGQQRRNS